MNAGMYSSATDDWATPPDFFARMAASYGIPLWNEEQFGNDKE